jgi:hypothetical protein
MRQIPYIRTKWVSRKALLPIPVDPLHLFDKIDRLSR